PSEYLDRCVDRPKALLRTPCETEGTPLEEQHHRPEHRWRSKTLVLLDTDAEIRESGLGVAQQRLRNAEQALADRRPDLKVVVVGDLEHADRTFDHGFRFAKPQTKQTRVEVGIGRGE